MKNNNHVMLDLETLSTAKDACIIQISALEFDPTTGAHGRTFNTFVNDSKGPIWVSTVAWWLQQAPAARIGASVSALGLSESDALDDFESWVKDVNPAALWSHGATFDIVVLDSAYGRHGVSKPWSYRIERDTRTLYALAPGGMPKVETDASRVHDAAYDCEVQVKQVVGALAALRGDK